MSDDHDSLKLAGNTESNPLVLTVSAEAEEPDSPPYTVTRHRQWGGKRWNITVSFDTDDGRLSCTRISIEGDQGQPVPASLFRLPMGEVVHEALAAIDAELTKMDDFDAVRHATGVQPTDDPRYAPNENIAKESRAALAAVVFELGGEFYEDFLEKLSDAIAQAGPGRRFAHDGAFYLDVARVYTEAWRRRQRPNKAVKDWLEKQGEYVSDRQVKAYVQTCRRKLGLLPHTAERKARSWKPGKAPWEAAPAPQATAIGVSIPQATPIVTEGDEHDGDD